MSRQIIFIIILTLLILGTGYVWYSYSPPSPGPAGSEVESFRDREVGALLTELRRLKSLRLDVSVLKDGAFGALRHPDEILPSEEKSAGRSNPFLPF